MLLHASTSSIELTLLLEQVETNLVCLELLVDVPFGFHLVSVLTKSSNEDLCLLCIRQELCYVYSHVTYSFPARCTSSVGRCNREHHVGTRSVYTNRAPDSVQPLPLAGRC